MRSIPLTCCHILIAALCCGVDCESNSTVRLIGNDGERAAVERASPPKNLQNLSVGKSVGAAESRVVLQRVTAYGAAGRDSDGRAAVDETVRVVLVFDGEAVYRRGELPATRQLPRRLFIDMESVELGAAVPSLIPVSAGGLRRIRAFSLDSAKTRVSFDVEDNAAYRLFFLPRPFRIIMDFRLPRSRGQTSAGGERDHTIVLDPGHGGRNTGAHGPDGLKESRLTLDLARRVRSELTYHLPRARVFLTRNSNRDVSLEERTALANGYAADIFVSIHFNASSSPTDKGGVSTFILDTTDDRQALRLAARENGTSEKDVSALQVVLASLYRKDQVSRSRLLAEQIQRQTLRAGRRMLPDLVDRGVKRALFFVLVGARMPAVLVEASFITNAVEAAALHTDRYRQLLAEGISRGIIRHLQSQRKNRQ